MFILSKGKPKTLNFIRDRENKRSGVESMSSGGLSVDGVKASRIKKEMKAVGKRKKHLGSMVLVEEKQDILLYSLKP